MFVNGLKTKIIIAMLCALILSVAPSALAAPVTVTLDASMSAWYEQRFSTYTGPSRNQNYVVGFTPGSFGDKTYRNLFVFDLSGVSESAASAELHLTRGSGGGLDPFATYTLYQVTASAAEVMDGGTNAEKEVIWNDLGSGVVYGSAQISNSSGATELVTVDLNAEALADINAADGLFVMGGALSPVSTNGGMRFGHTHPGSTPLGSFVPIRQLTMTVPEPSTLMLAAIGFLSLFAFAGRRYRVS